jgi:pimeloyl-ACP methyl ester carboxylesterase
LNTLTVITTSVVAVLAVVALVWYGTNNNDTLRGIKLALRLPGHREALLSQCSSMPVPQGVETGSLPINLTHWGQAGPRMLLIHGGVQGNLGGGPTTFAKQEPLSRNGWQLILPERPGFGKSPSRGPDDMESDAVWISGMLDDVVLIGHSFGGAEALLAAAQRPDGVRALILVEPALHALLPRSKVMETNHEARKEFLQFGEASLSSKTPAEYGMVFARNLGPGTDAGTALANDPDKAASLGCALLRARMASPEKLRTAAETVARAKIPVLAISGGWSPAFNAIGELTAELTHGEHVIVPSMNHFPQLMNPDVFNDAIAAFVSKRARRRETAEGSGKGKE